MCRNLAQKQCLALKQAKGPHKVHVETVCLMGFMQKWSNFNADFLVLVMGQCIIFLQGKVPYFLINYSLTPYADVGSYNYESLKIVFWVFQLTGYYFSYYAVLAVRTPYL